MTLPILLDAFPTWAPDGLCAQPGADPEDWFPRKGDKAAAERAKRVCVRCPVAAKCLTYALDNEGEVASHRFGVYGGTSANERHLAWLKRRGKAS